MPNEKVQLTPSQFAVLTGLSQGWDIAIIARACQISKRTVYRRLADAGHALGVLPAPVVIRSEGGSQIKRYAKLTTPKIVLIVQRAGDAGLIDPRNIRLTASGNIALTPGAASRGVQL
jgi:hypothetical protein